MLALRDHVADVYERLSHVDQERHDIRTRARERTREAALLRHGLAEVESVSPQAGEDASLAATLRREIGEELAIEIEVGAPVTTVKHAYTHFRITLHTFLCRHSRGRVKDIGCAGHRWVTVDRLDTLAFPKADRVVLEELQELTDW